MVNYKLAITINLKVMKETEEVSQQAFLEELQSWAGTLGREAKKLKHLRKAVGSKLQINTIDIALINIESELIQYKKIRERVSLAPRRSTRKAASSQLLSSTLPSASDSSMSWARSARQPKTKGTSILLPSLTHPIPLKTYVLTNQSTFWRRPSTIELASRQQTQRTSQS